MQNIGVVLQDEVQAFFQGLVHNYADEILIITGSQIGSILAGCEGKSKFLKEWNVILFEPVCGNKIGQPERKAMNVLSGKNVLVIIPKSQFCEKELYGVKSELEQRGVRVVVLSMSGQEARGMNKEKFQPDGMIVDWNKQPGVRGKYQAVVLIGGKGARKSLWEDPIVPQILTDHYRSGSVIAAMGSAIVVLVRASLVTGEIPLPQDEATRDELELLNANCIDTPVTSMGNSVFGQGADSVSKFSQTILGLMETGEAS